MTDILLRLLLLTGVLAVLGLTFFILVYRPVMRRWGTSETERVRVLPGDGLLTGYAFSYTQAITIEAPREIVWAYLQQVGYQRAGWYNLDFINGLIKDYFFEGGKSANRIIPELQGLKAGDTIKIVPEMGFVVEELKEAELLLLVGYEPGAAPGTAPLINTWVFTLEETAPGRTRLLTRFKTRYPDSLGLKVMMAVINEAGGAGLQQPAMLRGLKKRAEAELYCLRSPA
jgi:hypothetical protein